MPSSARNPNKQSPKYPPDLMTAVMKTRRAQGPPELSANEKKRVLNAVRLILQARRAQSCSMPDIPWDWKSVTLTAKEYDGFGYVATTLTDIERKNAIIAATDRYIESQAVFKQMKACADSMSGREC
jgi:hypothetical protein